MPARTRTGGWVRSACLLGLVTHAAHGLTGFGGPAVDELVVDWLYDLLMATAVVVCAVHVRQNPSERGAWSLIAAGIAASLLGDLAYAAGLGDPSGQPTVCDAASFAFYPLVLAGCVRLAASGDGHRPAASWLDALGAALSGPPTSAGTVRATPTAWRRRRSRSAPVSSRRATLRRHAPRPPLPGRGPALRGARGARALLGHAVRPGVVAAFAAVAERGPQPRSPSSRSVSST